MLGMELGADALRAQAEKFGFGDALRASRCGSAPSVDPRRLNPPQIAQSAIGQYDVRVTPLQMAMVARGDRQPRHVMKPYLVADASSAPTCRVHRA